MTRLALFGLGNIGMVHLNNLRSLRGCTLSGVFDVRTEHCRSVARDHGLTSYPDRNELLADARIDAVVIATPSSSHRELVAAALGSGKHVFVEKPLAGTRKDAESIAQCAKSSNRVVQVGFCERFNPNYLEAKRAVESGALGKIRAIYSSRIAPYGLGDPSWELGVLDTAVHNFDLILWLMRQAAVRVFSRGVQVYSDSAIPHSVVTMLEFGDGAIANDQVVWLKDEHHPLHQCARSRMLVIGTRGTFEINLEMRQSSLLTSDRYQMIDTVLLGASDYYSCLRLQFEGFLRSIEENATVVAPVEDALKAEMVALAAHESLVTGREVVPR